MNLESALLPTSLSDLETLVQMRIAAMRESLERLGRFDPQRPGSVLPQASRPNAATSSSVTDSPQALSRANHTVIICACSTCTSYRNSKGGASAPRPWSSFWNAPPTSSYPSTWMRCAAVTRIVFIDAWVLFRWVKVNGIFTTFGRRIHPRPEPGSGWPPSPCWFLASNLS
ncbi:hypothetical protein PBOI14_65400 [Pseudomonas sp. Boi14]|nr:hypothetical protein PBOI14_65400 [Pseudomonas sp. Boi14]